MKGIGIGTCSREGEKNKKGTCLTLFQFSLVYASPKSWNSSGFQIHIRGWKRIFRRGVGANMRNEGRRFGRIMHECVEI